VTEDDQVNTVVVVAFKALARAYEALKMFMQLCMLKDMYDQVRLGMKVGCPELQTAEGAGGLNILTGDRY